MDLEEGERERERDQSKVMVNEFVFADYPEIRFFLQNF